MIDIKSKKLDTFYIKIKLISVKKKRSNFYVLLQELPLVGSCSVLLNCN